MPPAAPDARSAGPPWLVTPLVDCDTPLLAQYHAALAGGADLVELRVDRIGDVAACESFLATVRGDGRTILTIRAAAEGGRWDGDDDERIALFERLGLLLPGWIDIELAAWERSANLRQKIGLVAGAEPVDAAATLQRPRNRLILSAHDWSAAPVDIESVFDRFAHTPAAIRKLAFTVRDASDALRLLNTLGGRAPGAWAVLSMGLGGVAGRILAGACGSALTFAAASPETSSAPGQPVLNELLTEYRWRSIRLDTPVFGVVGWPVAHSRSPRLHNAAMRAADIDGVYLPFAVAPTPRAFAAFMDGLAQPMWQSVRGLSITAPHKQNALEWLQAGAGTVTRLAQRCGAVNTLSRAADGQWIGDNTDYAGALASLAVVAGLAPCDPASGAVPERSALRDALQSRCVELLGAGGAARAFAVALADVGAQVQICNRTPHRAAELARRVRTATNAPCTTIDWDARGLGDAEIVVNCTTLGMQAGDESPLPAERLSPRCAVVETIYAPPRTALLEQARRCGARTAPGAVMFLAQAAEQFRIWHGRPMDAAALRALWNEIAA